MVGFGPDGSKRTDSGGLGHRGVGGAELKTENILEWAKSKTHTPHPLRWSHSNEGFPNSVIPR